MSLSCLGLKQDSFSNLENICMVVLDQSLTLVSFFDSLYRKASVSHLQSTVSPSSLKASQEPLNEVNHLVVAN